MKIALLERRLMHGGGLATVEATLPGFYHNSHSINHFHISAAPWFQDLGLAATQAPPGKHTTDAWHVMPLNPDLGDKAWEEFEGEFTERIIERFAHYAPNMTRRNILKTCTYTARTYGAELLNMRSRATSSWARSRPTR